MENQNPVSAVRVSRRGLMKAGVAASAAKIAGIPITVVAANEAAAAEQGIKSDEGRVPFLRHGLRPPGRHEERQDCCHEG
ncbi:MAG: hypothetical protein V8S69_07635 [Dakarella massiliensis]